MADTSTTDETVKPGDTQTEATTTSAPAAAATTTTVTAPPQDNASAAEVERLRKEKEQTELRVRQLENEAAARKKADDEAEAKRLENNQEYKTLAEQEREKREAAERALEERDAREELAKAKADAVKDYPAEVTAQAKELGIDLTSSDEAAVTAFKEKLDKLNGIAAPSANDRVTSNNGRQTTTSRRSEQEAIQDYANGNESAIEEVMSRIPFIADNTPKQ